MKELSKYKIWVVAAAFLFMFGMMPSLTSAAVIGSVNLSVTPTLGGAVTVSGSCGDASANQAITINLTPSDSDTMSLGSVTANGSGAFSSTVAVPGNVAAGPATFEAVCGTTGDTLLTNTHIATPLSVDLAIGGSIVPGGGISVSGSCSGIGANGTASFSFVQNGVTTGLGTANVGANGSFNANLAIPGSAVAGPATLIAVCSAGGTIDSNITVLAAPPAAPVEDPADPDEPEVLGEAIPIPEGGVAAGGGGAQNIAYLAILLAGSALYGLRTVCTRS